MTGAAAMVEEQGDYTTFSPGGKSLVLDNGSLLEHEFCSYSWSETSSRPRISDT